MFDGIFYLYLKILDSFLFPLLLIKPVLAIFIISTTFSLLSIGISILTVDKEALRKVKEKMSSLQEEMKTAQKEMNNEALTKLAEEAMKTNFQILKLKSKSMIIVLLLTFPFFPWLNYHFSGIPIAKLPIFIPIIGSSVGWILWYIFVSLTIAYVVQKIIGIEYV
jgi:uncharacterized membrane protein (DUF106 family)